MAIRDLGLPPHEPEGPYLIPSRKRPRWKRVIVWTAGILVALVVVAVIGVYVLLHSQKFHNYVLNLAEQKATVALNTPVKLQNFGLHFHNLGLDLYGLTVYGAGPGAGQPLLQVDHIGLGVRILSVARRQWNLDSVTVDHPVVDLIVGANGQNNLPTATPIPTSSISRCGTLCWTAGWFITTIARRRCMPT